MKKVLVMYWSSTGNTAKMAEAVAQGVKDSGNEADVVEAENFQVNDETGKYDAYALGCSAQGMEQIEGFVFEPALANLEPLLANKKVGLFGSYGWGGGKFMVDFENRICNDRADLVEHGIVYQGEPDEETLNKCKALGAELVK